MSLPSLAFQGIHEIAGLCYNVWIFMLESTEEPKTQVVKLTGDVSYWISAKPWEVKAHKRVSRSTDLTVHQLLYVRCICQPGRELQVSLGTLTQNIRAPERGSTSFTTNCLVSSILILERKQLEIGPVSLVTFLTAGAIDDVCLLLIYYMQFIIFFKDKDRTYWRVGSCFISSWCLVEMN